MGQGCAERRRRKGERERGEGQTRAKQVRGGQKQELTERERLTPLTAAAQYIKTRDKTPPAPGCVLPPLTASIDYQNPIYSTPTAEKTDWEAPEFHTSSFDDPSLRGETDTVPLLSLFLHPPFVLSRSLVYIYIYILFTPLNPGQFSRIKPRSLWD